MVNPEVSPYESDPWQPTVDTSTKDGDNEKAAAKKYDSYYGGAYTDGSNSGDDGKVYDSYPDPTLAMVFTQAPDLVPTPQLTPPSSSGSAGTVDLSYEVDVQLADLRSTEQTCLTETSALVDAYNSLKGTVTSAVNSATIFGQNVGDPGGKDPRVADLGGDGPTASQYNSEGQDFATSMNSQMEQLLQQSGNAIELLGQFVSMLNVAGQMYAETDATALNAWRPSKDHIR